MHDRPSHVGCNDGVWIVLYTGQEVKRFGELGWGRIVVVKGAVELPAPLLESVKKGLAQPGSEREARGLAPW
jgi:hypothetical protein